MATVVRMPAALAQVTEGAVQTWLVKLGQPVRVGDLLAEFGAQVLGGGVGILDHVVKKRRRERLVGIAELGECRGDHPRVLDVREAAAAVAYLARVLLGRLGECAGDQL